MHPTVFATQDRIFTLPINLCHVLLNFTQIRMLIAFALLNFKGRLHAIKDVGTLSSMGISLQAVDLKLAPANRRRLEGSAHNGITR